jgi:hypothetical protein
MPLSQISGARSQLRVAGKIYSQCAKRISLHLTVSGQFTPVESEQLIAFGIASDWCRRAAVLRPLTYLGRKMNKSKRSAGLTELIRFNFAWWGMNALFSREAIRGLLPNPAGKSELERFNVVFSHAQLPAAYVSDKLKILHQILLTKVTTRVAGVTLAPLTTLESIFLKYTTPEIQQRATGKKIKAAISTNNIAALDLPNLIYLMRNWSVHGALLDSSFRSEVRFKAYFDTLLAVLSEVHANISQALLQKL